jgi:uncharacterized phage protein gp47/JayE
MADELTATGLNIDDLQTRIDTVVATLRSTISAEFNASTDQPTGQLVQIQTEQIQEIAELLQDLYSAIDPDQATGQSLDALSSITGTYRRAATQGTVTLTLNMNAGITVGAGSLAADTSSPAIQWATDVAVTSVGAGNYTVAATCQTAGNIPEAPGAISVIVTPVAGWNTVTNVGAAVAGLDLETDVELRLRRELEVTQSGSTSADSIRAAVIAITGVLEAFVLENDSWAAVAPIPGHAFETVYWPGTSSPTAALITSIAEAIFDEKPIGIQAFGTDIGDVPGSPSETVTDEQGNTHEIGFTIADEQVIDVEVTVVEGDNYAGDAAVIAAIVAYGAADLTIGDDVYRSQISGSIIDLSGVDDVSLVRLAIQPAALANVDIAITQRQIATIDTANVTVIVV